MKNSICFWLDEKPFYRYETDLEDIDCVRNFFEVLINNIQYLTGHRIEEFYNISIITNLEEIKKYFRDKFEKEFSNYKTIETECTIIITKENEK